MKLSKDKKKDILIESFNVLKEDIINNGYKIGDLLDICYLLDEQLATDMWEHLIDSNIDELGNIGYGFSCRLLSLVLDCSGNHICESKFSYIVYNNNKIRNAIFNLSDEVGSSYKIISQLIKEDKIDKANHLLELVYNNDNKSVKFSEYLDSVISCLPYPDDVQLSNAATSMLSNWIDKISEKNEKARLNISLLTKLSD